MSRNRHRDPVELLLARILRQSVQGSLWGGAASLALSCSTDDAGDRARTEDFAASADAGARNVGDGATRMRADAASDAVPDARVTLDATATSCDASGPGSDASASDAFVDASDGDAAIQLDASPASDAGIPSDAAVPADALALTCPAQGHLPVQAARLRPGQPFDYVAVREAQATEFGADAGAESWTRSSFTTVSETGTRCATASSDACSAKAAKHPEQLVNSYCVQLCQEYSVVTTRGDQVERWATAAQLLQLLAPVDSFDDALMLVASAGYALTCNDATRSSVREVADGYEVYATRITSACDPVVTTRYRLHVARDGTLRELDSVELEHSDNVCIGRVPAGLTSVSADRQRSALGDYLARCAHLEAASVHAFERLARELFAYGAPSRLINDALEAAADEVEHAHAIGALARAYGGEPVEAEVEALPRRALEEIAIENAVEGCVRETYGALIGAYQAEHAGEPLLRRAMVKIAADEARHAALSQRVHAWALGVLDAAACARVRAAQRRAVAQLARECGDLGCAPDEALRRELGLPPPEVARWFVSQLTVELWDEGVVSVA